MKKPRRSSVRQKKRYLDMINEGHLYWLGSYNRDQYSIILPFNLTRNAALLEICYSEDTNYGSYSSAIVVSLEEFMEVEYLWPMQFKDLPLKFRTWIKKKKFTKEFINLIGSIEPKDDK